MFGGGMGGGAGGGMLRAVGRTAARAGFAGNTSSFQEPLSSSASNASPASQTSASRCGASKKLSGSNNHNNLSISSAGSPFSSLPANANSGLPGAWPACVSSPTSASSCCDEFEWVSVDGTGEERRLGFLDDFVLGPVPSIDEVQNAVSALEQVFDPCSYPQLVKDKYSYNVGKDMGDHILGQSGLMHQVSSAGSEQDWKEPSMHLCNSRMLQPHLSDRMSDAFHLLRTEPLVQRMVTSLSSDKAVWAAVLNNEVVRELRESCTAVGEDSPLGSDKSDEDNEAMNVVEWIFNNAKAKAMEVLEKVMKLVSELFRPLPEEKATAAAATDPLDGKLRTSFMLSVVVMLIIVVTRARGGRV